MFNELPPGLTHVLAQTRLHTDDAEYVVISFAPEQVVEGLFLFSRLGVPFSTAVVDKDEVTLLLPWEAWYQVRDEAQSYAEARGYRLITFDTPTELGLIGFIATLSSLLAEAGISIYSVSAFTRDHILVQEEDLGRAVEVLEAFFAECRSGLEARA
jgi:hypothetical protein